MSTATRILWVDPEITAPTLRSPHLEVVHATTAAEALRRVREHGFAAVVSELRLDGSATGLELAKQLRLRKVGVPVVFVSAHARAFSEAAILAVEPSAFFSKPVDPRALELTLLRLAARRGESPSRPSWELVLA